MSSGSKSSPSSSQSLASQRRSEKREHKNLQASLKKLAKTNEDYRPLLEQAKKIRNNAELQRKAEKSEKSENKPKIEPVANTEAFIKEIVALKAEIIDLKRKNFKYGIVFKGKHLPPRSTKKLKKAMISLILRKFGVIVKPHEMSDCHFIKKGVLVEWNDRTEDSSYRRILWSNKKNGINPKISIGAEVHLSTYDEKLKFICRKLKSWKEIDCYGVCEVSGKVWFEKDGSRKYLNKEDDVFDVFDESIKNKLKEADKVGNIGNSDLTYLDANFKEVVEENSNDVEEEEEDME